MITVEEVCACKAAYRIIVDRTVAEGNLLAMALGELAAWRVRHDAVCPLRPGGIGAQGIALLEKLQQG